MRNLIFTLLATSSVDSLNPIGITQQFILQGMVKKPRHIWYFILTTAVVNIIFGYLVYYGAIKIVNELFVFLLSKYAFVIFSLEICFGFGLLFFGIGWLIKKIYSNRKDVFTSREKQLSKENDFKTNLKHITPFGLINIGIISTVSELTSAVPYFVFLSVLTTYHFSFGILTFVLICYNIIYIAPFVLLYVVYILSKKNFDKIYVFFKEKCSTLLGYSVPLLLLVVAMVVIHDGIVNTLSVI